MITAGADGGGDGVGLVSISFLFPVSEVVEVAMVAAVESTGALTGPFSGCALI